MTNTVPNAARRQLSLPEDICRLAEQRFGKRFESLESILEFVLRELTENDAEVLDQTEQKILERRLRDLGYI